MAIGRRIRREIKSEINIVPLLDVLLVLLLIFMATAPVISQSVEVDLPESSDSKTVASDDNPPVILEVAGIGQYALSINRERQTQLSPEEIVTKAQELLTANPKTIFLIGGAKEVPYEEVIKALDMLHKAGVKSVGLMTQAL